MQGFLKLHLKSSYGEKTRKDIIEKQFSKSEYWLSTEYGEIVLGYWKLPSAKCLVKLHHDKNLECETDLKNAMPARLGSFF